jgi:tyrosyl-tRNA synthetase
LPEELPALQVTSREGVLPIANVLKEAGLTASTSDALRMIKQGAVRIDGERVEDPNLILSAGACHVYQVGKRRFARITLE